MCLSKMDLGHHYVVARVLLECCGWLLGHCKTSFKFFLHTTISGITWLLSCHCNVVARVWLEC